MDLLYHQLIDSPLRTRADAPALKYKGKVLSYASLKQAVESVSAGLRGLGLQQGARVAVYLPKQEETVIAFFAISRAGGIFVPVNPALKPRQVAHILADSGAMMLVTSTDRAALLADILPRCVDLKKIVITDFEDKLNQKLAIKQDLVNWLDLLQYGPGEPPYIDTDDSVAILYTSGSTGKPKGVVVSHKNLVIGSESVCNYLKINEYDRVLALLPFSFDYGLNQLSTAIRSGACLVLMNYLLPMEVIKIVSQEAITGLAAVPSLWTQLSALDWPESARESLRYITSSGGTMPQPVLKQLQVKFPETEIYLMYGLTEAFRSTYLPPEELNRRPTSIGKAIPNAYLSVVKPDGSPCAPGEPGELVHHGPLVAKGYWNNPEKTARHFRPLPGSPEDTDSPEIAAWSGDTVTMDEDGFLYFIGRDDDMIKTSGYRVSPTEIEDMIHDTGLVHEVVVFGVPHPVLGQAIVAVVSVDPSHPDPVDKLLRQCNMALPRYMVPAHIDVVPEIPRTPHGKLDRKRLAEEAQTLFMESDAATRVTNATP